MKVFENGVIGYTPEEARKLDIWNDKNEAVFRNDEEGRRWRVSPDYYIRIDDFIPAPENEEANGNVKERNPEYRKGLYNEFLMDGQTEAIEIYTDIPYCTSGHNRHETLKENGITMFPAYENGVKYSDTSRLDRDEAIVRGNYHYEVPLWQKFMGAEKYGDRLVTGDSKRKGVPYFSEEWTERMMRRVKASGIGGFGLDYIYKWYILRKTFKSTELPDFTYTRHNSMKGIDEDNKIPITRDGDDLLRDMESGTGNFDINTQWRRMRRDCKNDYDALKDKANATYRKDTLFGDDPEVDRNFFIPVLADFRDYIFSLLGVPLITNTSKGQVKDNILFDPDMYGGLASKMLERLYKNHHTDKYGTQWEENKNSLMDCIPQGIDGVPSPYTTIEDKAITRDGVSDIYWTTGKAKIGFNKVFVINRNNPNEMFLAIIWVKNEMYKGGLGKRKLYLNEVAQACDGTHKEVTGKVLCGSIERDSKGKYQMAYENVSEFKNPNKEEVVKLTAEDRRPGKVTASQHSFY